VSTLAIDGGPPVRRRPLPYGRQIIDAADIAAVVAALQSDWLTTGPAVECFEREFARAVGAAHAVALSNGTAALHAAAFAAGVGPARGAVTTPLTFAATANCARYLGAPVTFADVDPATLNISPARVAEVLDGDTAAIIAVDYGGQPADLDELRAMAEGAGALLIEDASHALGAEYKGRPAGSIAHMTTFSLHPVKHITTGEGGMVTTDDAALAARVRRFRNHGIDTDARQREAEGSWFYAMRDLGFNYRLTDLQCALGSSQLKHLPAWVERRRAIADRYRRLLEGEPAVELPHVRDDRSPAWHLYVVRLNLARLRVDRGRVFRALRAENIGVNVHYIPVPWHPYYEGLGYRRGSWPVCEAAYERLLSLPMWAGMSDGDVDDVVAALKKVLGAYAS
jgi:UDP-4-amino-4,6-dideoxy-N-acetyl-beta-L-altrosamine transaminase